MIFILALFLLVYYADRMNRKLKDREHQQRYFRLVTGDNRGELLDLEPMRAPRRAAADDNLEFLLRESLKQIESRSRKTQRRKR